MIQPLIVAKKAHLMKEEKTEGIVLRSQPYQEKNRIISVLTLNAGLVQMIVKGISMRTPHLLTLTTPFTCAEFHYIEKGSTLFRFSEGSLIDEHLHLRKKFDHLKAAGAMTEALLQQLLPGSPDPLIYTLYKIYLKQIPTFEDLGPLLASFYIKLLKHESLLTETAFSPSDRSLVHALAEARSFDTLRALPLTPSLALWTANFTRPK